MSARFLAAALLALPLLGATEAPPPAADNGQAAWAAACKGNDGWDTPGPPFRIHGDTWYVGTCGISAILVTTDDGHALIDSGTEAGADIVLANIAKLGFKPKDVKLLLASHEHFDHVGGMAKIQKATGAVFISSSDAVDVLISGEANPDDPQAGMHPPMARISDGLPYDWGDAPYRIDYFGISPYPTPGHTPGAMTWSWESCKGTDCKTIVYADSLSPISSDTYRFSDHPEYVAAFRAGLAELRALKCDILLTPHPSASDMIARARTGTLVGGMSCAQYADAKTKALDERLAKEVAAK